MNCTKLKELRLKKGVTQAEVAEYAGVTVCALRRYENAQGTPLLGTAVRLSEYYGLTFDEVFLPLSQYGENKIGRT